MDEEDELDDNDTPQLMYVLVDSLLSLLPQSSSPMFYVVEQVFRCFYDDIPDDGLLRMLRIVKNDLRPPHHQAIDTDDDEDEKVLFGIEDSNEMNEPEVFESEKNDDRVVNSEAMTRVEPIKDDNDKAEPSTSDA